MDISTKRRTVSCNDVMRICSNNMGSELKSELFLPGFAASSRRDHIQIHPYSAPSSNSIEYDKHFSSASEEQLSNEEKASPTTSMLSAHFDDLTLIGSNLRAGTTRRSKCLKEVERYRCHDLLIEECFPASSGDCLLSDEIIACADVCDGIESTENFEVMYPEKNVFLRPHLYKDGSPLKVKNASGSDDATTMIWKLNDELVVIGFKEKASGAIYYISVTESDLVRITSGGEDPGEKGADEMAGDSRVLRYYKSSKTGKYHLQSNNHNKLYFYVNNDDFVEAREIDESDATGWRID